MIGKQTLKDYECFNIEDYFILIVESEVNGNHLQMRDYFNKLSKPQKKDFFNFLEGNNINNISVVDLM